MCASRVSNCQMGQSLSQEKCGLLPEGNLVKCAMRL